MQNHDTQYSHEGRQSLIFEDNRKRYVQLLFHDWNLDTSQPPSLRDLTLPLLRLAQARLSFGSGLLTHLLTYLLIQLYTHIPSPRGLASNLEESRVNNQLISLLFRAAAAMPST